MTCVAPMMNSPLAAKNQPLHLVVLDNVSIYTQLQLEEALLRADHRNWCLINRGSAPSIVMGISGKQDLLVNSNKMAENPVPIIRRFSGGGTVIVDSNTFFMTWICNTEHTGAECFPEHVHRWVEGFYLKALPALSMKLRENDYVIGERKFGGNAQYLSKGRWLHHSSFLWDYDPDMMDYLLMPAKTPKYRQQRDHNDFLCRLRSFYPEKQHLENQLLESLQDAFLIETVPFHDAWEMTNLPHRKATITL
jgi:lipoate-protein ligase A